MNAMNYPLLPAILFLCSCANQFEANFVDHRLKMSAETHANLIPFDGETELVKSQHKERDFAMMWEKGYSVIGRSAFLSRSVHFEEAKEHAQQIQAAVVLVSETFNHSLPPFWLARPFSRTYRRYYNYLATYWVKHRPQPFGIHMRELTPEERRYIGRNCGVYVDGVVKGGPAFKANVVNGDIIISFSGKEVVDIPSVGQLIKANLGKKVDVVVLRDEVVGALQKKSQLTLQVELGGE